MREIRRFWAAVHLGAGRGESNPIDDLELEFPWDFQEKGFISKSITNC